MKNKYMISNIIYALLTLISAVIVGLNAPSPMMAMVIQLIVSAVITYPYTLIVLGKFPQKKTREE